LPPFGEALLRKLGLGMVEQRIGIDETHLASRMMNPAHERWRRSVRIVTARTSFEGSLDSQHLLHRNGHSQPLAAKHDEVTNSRICLRRRIDRCSVFPEECLRPHNGQGFAA
jgi:hypothetical protein